MVIKTALFLPLLITLCNCNFAQNILKNIQYGGTLRTYRIYIPSSYDGMQAVPLVMALHGLGDNADNFQGIGLNSIADTAGFIVVYPNALPDPVLGAPGWNAGLNPLNNTDDVGFLLALIDTVRSVYAIDTMRIYVCGFSLGGFMSYRLACARDNPFAALASVAGSLPASAVPTCNPGRPLPVLHVHGTADPVIPYNFGLIYGIVTNLGADSTIHFWRQNNACEAPPIHDTLPDTHPDGYLFEKWVYGPCADSAAVVLYKANNMPHVWPLAQNDVHATREIWNFFRSFSRQAFIINSSGEKNKDKEALLIYPNPAAEILFIQTSFSQGTEMAILDFTGRQVHVTPMQGTSYAFSLSALPQGVYFLRAVSGKTVMLHKIMIQR
ncbi:MAG: hypothetical protein KatS3mg031_1192 [Chitinophagales bacterium]|nr:MAG: hypothetical protein KatS3mg031_1192 [Chitinophagales bacterium]